MWRNSYKHYTILYNSIVTKDIPSYEIWAGVPAWFIKKYE